MYLTKQKEHFSTACAQSVENIPSVRCSYIPKFLAFIIFREEKFEVRAWTSLQASGLLICNHNKTSEKHLMSLDKMVAKYSGSRMKYLILSRV